MGSVLRQKYINWYQGRSYHHNALVTTWDKLRATMEVRFGDQYIKETARANIQKAKQGNKKVKQYILEFSQDIQKAELPEDQLVQYLLGGVNEEIWEMIRQKDLSNLTFVNTMEMLTIAEKNYVTREIAAEQRRRQQRGINSSQPQTSQRTYFQNTRKEVPDSRPKPQPSSTQVYRPSQQQTYQQRPNPSYEKPLPQGEPMDIDRLRKNKPSGSKVKCFKCRQFGHVFKNCPIKTIRELREDGINEILEQHLNREQPREEVNISGPYTKTEEYEEIPEENEEEEDTHDLDRSVFH